MIDQKFTKNLIAIEIELGFVRVSNRYKNLFPSTKSKIRVYLGNAQTGSEVGYNPKHQRIFGLVKFFRSGKAKPKDILEIEKLDNRKFRLIIKKLKPQEKEKLELSQEEAEEIIDLSGLGSKVKGDIVEDRIKDLILLYGQGLLNVYRPSSDIEGVDLVVKKKDVFQPLFIQVKSRWKLLGKRGLLFQIAEKNFKSHHTYYLIGAYFDPRQLALHDLLVFIPTKKIKKEATIIKNKDRRISYRFTVPLDLNSKSRFTKYLIRKTDLVNELFEKFERLEEVLR